MVIIDYVSFTFCPEDLVPYRKLAAAGNQSFAQFMANRDESEPAINVDFLNQSCRENLLTFVQHISKDFFRGQEYSTDEAWYDLFSVRGRDRGMFGYKESWNLYLNGVQIGIAASGAKNGGCYVSFSGEGTALINPYRLYNQIRHLPMIKITRCDLAFDDQEGVCDYNYARRQYRKGFFRMRSGGSDPDFDVFKSGGKLVTEDGVTREKFTGGRTFQVGSRKSGKLCRIYEKGKQLGNPDSKWTRWEVELHSKDREIPLYILTDPASYFLGSYPVLEVFRDRIKESENEPPKQITTSRKQNVKITYDHLVDSARTSYGALINVMRQSRQMSDSEIVAELISVDDSAVPRRLEKSVGATLPIYDSGPWMAPVVNNQGASSCLN